MLADFVGSSRPRLFVLAICLASFAALGWYMHDNPLAAGIIVAPPAVRLPSSELPLPPKESKVWAVITSINKPLPAVLRLCDDPNINVVVVADLKTPTEWHAAGCMFLSVELQQALGYATQRLLPNNHYGRKNVGYLFAIQQGAEWIYDTDDDNQLIARSLTDGFHVSSVNPSIVFPPPTASAVINPYVHFGQPNMWPRGYPLGAVGEQPAAAAQSASFEYCSTSSQAVWIQQGLANGDPDVDAIFRMTRKRSGTKIDVAFDATAPSLGLVPGTFSPFNSQNTLFERRAFWALLIPTTTTFRVCDIWRGYWAQRLLWEVGSMVAFTKASVYQDRNEHDYFHDFLDEQPLYVDTPRLLTFLRAWKRPASAQSLFDVAVALSADMAHEGFWKPDDVELLRAWVSDLVALGYQPPPLVPAWSRPNCEERVNFAPRVDLPTSWVRASVELAAPAGGSSSSIGGVSHSSNSNSNNNLLERAEDIARFQRRLWENQNPPNCSEAKFLYVETPVVSGLGSLLHGLVPQLWDGLASGRAVIFDENQVGAYANPEECPSRSFDCYFLPTSHCSAEFVRKLREQNASIGAAAQVLSVSRRASVRLPYLHADELSMPYSIAWYQKELMRYFMRPLPVMERRIQELRELTGIPPGESWISVHYRGGQILKKEGVRQPLEVYARVLKHLVAQEIPTKYVLVESDDQTAVEQFQQSIPSLRFARVPASEFVSSNATNRTHIMSWLHQAKPQPGKDEACTLLATMQLLAQGKFFLGAFSSNLARLVYEIMSWRSWPPPMFEIDNSPYIATAVTPSMLVCLEYGCVKGEAPVPWVRCPA